MVIKLHSSLSVERSLSKVNELGEFLDVALFAESLDENEFFLLELKAELGSSGTAELKLELSTLLALLISN